MWSLRTKWPLMGCLLLWFVVMTDGLITPKMVYGKDGKSCFGTQNGVAHGTDKKREIKLLREMYSNCTTVYGNLEIVGITTNDLKQEGLESLDFFENVEEVAGYILIGYTLLPRISFPRLRIIWGDKTFSPQTFSATSDGVQMENFSLLILSSNIDVFDLRSLRSVMEGRVGAVNASGLCHWKTNSIDWKQVLGPDYVKQNRFVVKSFQNDTCFKDEAVEKNCSGGCDYCWGPDPEHCQEIYRTGCAPQCITGMCFNTSDPLFCCHTECAAGCTGPRNDQCIGCRLFRDDGVCVDKCPLREVYNVKKMEYVYNPNGKFSWVRDCVKECPEHLFIYKDGCVARCPEGYFAESNETVCKRCDGPCPKTCVVDKPLNSLNINEFVNCTVIDGHLEIRQDTFYGGRDFEANGHPNFGGLSEEDLEVLNGVERITHYLFVQVDRLKSLKFLRNLKQIDGRKKYQERYAFYLTRMDEIQELGLSSLKTILDGDVYISGNPDLCFYYTLPWKRIAGRGGYDLGVGNRDKLQCEKQRQVCDDLCDPESGCWGKGPNMCFSCQYFKANQTCVRDCGQFENLYPKDKVCERCHDECLGCKGPGPRNCISCKNVLLDNTCVDKCPADSHYENKTEKRCALCDTRCSECTGPSNSVGPGGCSKCRNAIVYSVLDNTNYCLDERDCQWQPGLEGYHTGFAMSVGLQAFAVKACLPCHSACKSCASYGADEEKPSQCECKMWRSLVNSDAVSGSCLLERPRNTYNESNNLYPCHKDCEECFGPEAHECTKCRHFIDFLEKSKNQFVCLEECPPDRPHSTKESVCTDVDEAKVIASKNKQTQVISGVVLAGVFLALIVVCTILFVWRRRVRAMKYLPPNEVFEMHPEAKPNLARLRLILESELKKGPILGYGAFGTVFRGVWYADEKKTKILVAIKVLHESNPAAQKEMLDEAGMMASMENQYLVQLIGVCVGQQLMLVTPLFPLGNLLDYVQTNRAKIGSLALLRWCTQIATGMAYLEERRLVHRDLAARNVLVQTPYHVRITDFGLAKMLEYGEEELKIFEGKMPIKWLALECIQQKRYTHKSDVWAYGVTVWELLTFGEKPYRDVALQQIPYLLEQGVRLPQPSICSMDIYLLLINCWMVDANSRYSFKELVEKFSHMMKDPGRYLAIDGDALMRLPSYTSSDRRHILQQMATEEDEESLREANDFLRGSTSSPVLTPVSPFFSPFPGDSSAADSGAIAPHIVQEAARIRPGARSSTSSHRYASDPVKRVKTQSYVGKPTVVFEVPSTDTDNYLVPDSQQWPSTSSANDFSAAAPLSSSKNSLVYTPVLAGEGAPEDAGIDYYVYLRKAVSGSREGMACCDNKEYMNNNSGGASSEDGVAFPLLDGDQDTHLSHRSPEAETVV